jgi:hypothetical protein
MASVQPRRLSSRSVIEQGFGDILSVSGAEAAISAQRRHTLRVCRETAIASAAQAAAV